MFKATDTLRRNPYFKLVLGEYDKVLSLRAKVLDFNEPSASGLSYDPTLSLSTIFNFNGDGNKRLVEIHHLRLGKLNSPSEDEWKTVDPKFAGAQLSSSRLFLEYDGLKPSSVWVDVVPTSDPTGELFIKLLQEYPGTRLTLRLESGSDLTVDDGQFVGSTKLKITNIYGVDCVVTVPAVDSSEKPKAKELVKVFDGELDYITSHLSKAPPADDQLQYPPVGQYSYHTEPPIDTSHLEPHRRAAAVKLHQLNVVMSSFQTGLSTAKQVGIEPSTSADHLLKIICDNLTNVDVTEKAELHILAGYLESLTLSRCLNSVSSNAAKELLDRFDIVVVPMTIFTSGAFVMVHSSEKPAIHYSFEAHSSGHVSTAYRQITNDCFLLVPLPTIDEDTCD